MLESMPVATSIASCWNQRTGHWVLGQQAGASVGLYGLCPQTRRWMGKWPDLASVMEFCFHHQVSGHLC